MHTQINRNTCKFCNLSVQRLLHFHVSTEYDNVCEFSQASDILAKEMAMLLNELIV